MALLVTVMGNRGGQNEDQNELIRTLQQTVAELQSENARLRQQNGNPDTSN